MAAKYFDRVLNNSAAAAETLLEEQDEELQREKRLKRREQELRNTDTGMSASDAIQRILLAQRDKDYFRLMELALPEADALGQVVWQVTAAEVSKAYRRLSILVHPDKNPGEEARRAFEALNDAHRMLKDQNKLEGILKDHAERARARREEAEAKATLEERVVLNAQQVADAKALRKAQAQQLHDEIQRQMRDRQDAAKRKREGAEKSRYRRPQEEGASSGDEQQQQQPAQQQQQQQEDSGDEEAAQRRRQALARRRQQQRRSTGM